MSTTQDPPEIKIKSRFLLRACMAEIENSDKIQDCLRLLEYRAYRATTVQNFFVPVSVVVTHSCYEKAIDKWIESFDYIEEYMARISRLSYSYHPSDKAAIEWATTHVCAYHSAILITKELDLPF